MLTLAKVKKTKQIKNENQSDSNSIGFEQIIKLLIDYKKPIVIHNGIFDIMYTYNQFISDLPDSVDEFQN